MAQGKIPSPIAWQRKNYSIIEIFCAIWEDQRPTIKCKTLSLLSLSLDLSLEATNQFVHIVYKNQKNRIKKRFGSTRIRNKKKEGNLYPEGGQRPEGWTGLRAVARVLSSNLYSLIHYKNYSSLKQQQKYSPLKTHHRARLPKLAMTWNSILLSHMKVTTKNK